MKRRQYRLDILASRVQDRVLASLLDERAVEVGKIGIYPQGRLNAWLCPVSLCAPPPNTRQGASTDSDGNCCRPRPVSNA